MYPNELKKSIEEFSNFKGLFLERIRQLSLVDFVLDFNQRRNLFISLNNNAPFIVFNANLEDYPSGGDLHSFAIDLRRFMGGRLIGISQIENDMVLMLEFEQRNNLLDLEITTLYLELIPSHPQAVLINDKNTILAAYRYNHERGKDGRLIRRGLQYELPPKTPDLLPLRFSEHDKLNTYLSLFGEQIKRQNYRELYVFLEHNLKRLTKLIKNYESDLEKLDKLNDLYENANLLLTYKPAISASIVQIEGKNIIVDPLFNALENAEQIFKKAKKIKRSEEILNTRIRESNDKISYFSSILLQLDSLHLEDEIYQIYDELGILRKDEKRKTIPKLNPYFLIFENTRILFGKNNKQNDHLTFKIAKKKDTFLHIKNVPGAHIIIQDEKPTKKVLEFAGNLALFLSKKVDGEMTYTLVSNIKKGLHPGQVITKFEKVFYIRYNDDFTKIFKNDILRIL